MREGVRHDDKCSSAGKRVGAALMVGASEEDFQAVLERVLKDVAASDRATPVDPREAELAATERELEKIVKGVSPENLPLFDGRLTELRQKRDRLMTGLARKRREAASTRSTTAARKVPPPPGESKGPLLEPSQ